VTVPIGRCGEVMILLDFLSERPGMPAERDAVAL
jgi:hypothetical protein